MRKAKIRKVKDHDSIWYVRSFTDAGAKNLVLAEITKDIKLEVSAMSEDELISLGSLGVTIYDVTKESE